MSINVNTCVGNHPAGFLPTSIYVKVRFLKCRTFPTVQKNWSCKSTYQLWNTGASNGLYFSIVKSKSCRKRCFFGNMTQYHYIFPEHKAIWQTQIWNIKWLKLIRAWENNSWSSYRLYWFRWCGRRKTLHDAPFYPRKSVPSSLRERW